MGLQEPTTVRQVGHIWKLVAYESWHWGMGPERACDSATGVPIYGNHLHIHQGLYIYWDEGMGPKRPCDSATGVPIYGNHLHIHPGPCIGMRVWGLRKPATVRQECPYMEIICIYTQAHVLAWGYGA